MNKLEMVCPKSQWRPKRLYEIGRHFLFIEETSDAHTA